MIDIKDKLIEFKTVQLANEKGLCIADFIKLGELKQPHNWHRKQLNTNSFWYFNITQSELKRWLREKHDLVVSSNLSDSGMSFFPVIKRLVNSYVITKEVLIYKSYEKSLEKGLQDALKTIK
jgi:hypothetical protein